MRAGLEWEVEAEKGQKLAVNTDDRHDGALYHQAIEDFRGHLEGMMAILQLRGQLGRQLGEVPEMVRAWEVLCEEFCRT